MGVIRTKQEIEYDSIKLTNEYKNIHESLKAELKKAGNATDYYLNLIEDYMDMYITKRLLVRDIRARGVTIEYNNGGNQKGYKKNDSVEQRLKVNAQMLKLLLELNISPANIEDGDEDDSL